MVEGARFPGRQRGLTLTELLISVAIGLAVLAALIVVFLGARSAYRANEGLARVQEAGRFAVEFVAQDARRVGLVGCLSRSLRTGEKGTLENLSGADRFTAPASGIRGVHGYGRSALDGWNEKPARYRTGDVLVLRGATGEPTGVSSANPEDGEATLRDASPAEPGDYVVLSNCDRAFLFRVKAVNGDKLTFTDKAAKTLAFSEPEENLTRGSLPEVSRFVESSYFVGTNEAKRPSLYRRDERANGRIEEIELVENIEDMAIEFGRGERDRDGNFTITKYEPASAVEGWGAREWEEVGSVRISLLVVSPVDPEKPDAKNVITTNPQTVEFDGKAVDAGDGRLRHVFTTTVSLRNRTL